MGAFTGGEVIARRKIENGEKLTAMRRNEKNSSSPETTRDDQFSVF